MVSSKAYKWKWAPHENRYALDIVKGKVVAYKCTQSNRPEAHYNPVNEWHIAVWPLWQDLRNWVEIRED